MTASERLRALAADERWKSHDSTVLSGLALIFNDAVGAGILPLIADVVEAAERGRDIFDGMEGFPDTSPVEALRSSITALHDALEEA